MTHQYKPSLKVNLVTFGFLFSVPIVLIPLLSGAGGGAIGLLAAMGISFLVIKGLFYMFTGQLD